MRVVATAARPADVALGVLLKYAAPSADTNPHTRKEGLHAMKAKRGDLIVRVSTPHTHTIGSATETRKRVEILEVTSITRDGMVKAARDIAYDNSATVPRERWLNVKQIYVIPAADIDKPAVVAAVKSHHYPGHPDQPKPFDSVAEVKALLRQHLVKTGA